MAGPVSLACYVDALLMQGFTEDSGQGNEKLGGLNGRRGVDVTDRVGVKDDIALLAELFAEAVELCGLARTPKSGEVKCTFAIGEVDFAQEIFCGVITAGTFLNRLVAGIPGLKGLFGRQIVVDRLEKLIVAGRQGHRDYRYNGRLFGRVVVVDGGFAGGVEEEDVPGVSVVHVHAGGGGGHAGGGEAFGFGLFL